MFKIKYLLWGIVALLAFLGGNLLAQRLKSYYKGQKTKTKIVSDTSQAEVVEEEPDNLQSFSIPNMEEVSRAVPMGEYVIPIRDRRTSQTRYVSESFFN